MNLLLVCIPEVVLLCRSDLINSFLIIFLDSLSQLEAQHEESLHQMSFINKSNKAIFPIIFIYSLIEEETIELLNI